MQYLEIEQVTDILRVAYKNSRRDHLLLLLSFSHGLRRSGKWLAFAYRTFLAVSFAFSGVRGHSARNSL